MNETQTQNYEFGDFRVDGSKRLLIKGDGEPVPLTPKVFDLLLYLVRHAGKLIEKDELMTEIWADTIVEENNLSQNISILRRALGEKRGENHFIATVPGHGYKFVADVKESLKSQVSILKSDAPDAINPDEIPKNVEAERENLGTWDLRLETSQDQKLKTKNQIAANGERNLPDGIQNPQSKIQNPNRLFVLTVLGVLAIGSLGFYLWRENTKSVVNTPIKTIAVLPFKPLVLENRDEALEIGMADTLIARLGDNRAIVVRPLSSVRKFGNLEQDAVVAGRVLGVEAVLDGSVQRWGDKIRVNARLVKVADGGLLWTETFDEKFTDIFLVQDAISRKVAASLALRLSGDEKMRLTKRYTENVEAYGLYQKGRFHIFKLTPPEIQKGMSYFQQAIEIDPNYALAHVGLSDTYRSFALSGEIPATEVMPKAKAAANRALEIDAALAEAHSSLSSITFWYDWDWNAAEKLIKRALELDPNNADAHFFYAYILSNTGRHAEALAEVKRAGELDPLSLVINAFEGQFLLHAGQPDEASAKLQKTFDLDSNFAVAHLVAASVYIEKGMYAEAIAEARRTRELNLTTSQPIAFLCYALVKSGREAEARDELERLLKLANERYVSPYTIALIYNGLNDPDETFAWLERGFEKRDPRMTFLKVEPKWNNLRSEPRFISLLKRMNLE